MNNPSISVVIPAFNEEAYVEKCVVCLENELKSVCDDFEIIIVNDGSHDKTLPILEELKKSRPYVVIATHEKNRGLGGALKTGFALAQKEITFYSDCDLPFDFHELARALRIMKFKDADLITGFRHDRTSEGFIRIIYSIFYNLLIRLLFGVAVRDINFSFKLIKTEAQHEMNLQSEGSFIDAELIIKAHRMNLFICQIGIDYFKRKYGSSTLSSPLTIFKIIKEIFQQYMPIKNSKKSFL